MDDATHDPAYERWTARLRREAVPPGFRERVARRLEGEPGEALHAPPRSRATHRAARAALVLLAAAVFAGRLAALFLVFVAR
jgi:hypothetical protein